MNILSIFASAPIISLLLLVVVGTIIAAEVRIVLKKRKKHHTPTPRNDHNVTPFDAFHVSMQPQTAADHGSQSNQPPASPAQPATGNANPPSTPTPQNQPSQPANTPTTPLANQFTTQPDAAQATPPHQSSSEEGTGFTSAQQNGGGGGSKLHLSRQKLVLAAIVVLLAIAVPTTVLLVQQQQELRSRAKSCTGASNCSTTCKNGKQFSDICPANGAFSSCEAWAKQACQPHGGIATATPTKPPPKTPTPKPKSCTGASNCSTTCKNGKQFSDICPANGAFSSCEAWAKQACQPHGGIATATPKPQPGTPPPGATATPTPAIGGGCQMTYSGNSFTLSGTCAGNITVFQGPASAGCPTTANLISSTPATPGTYSPSPPGGTCQQVDYDPDGSGQGGGGVCSCSGTSGPPPGTPPPTTTPPPSPTPPVAAQCQAIKVYIVNGAANDPANWQEILHSQLPNLQRGQVIRIAAQGSGTSAQQTFDQARFRINGGNWVTSTNINPFGEYFIAFTIPQTVDNFTFETELHHSTLNQWF